MVECEGAAPACLCYVHAGATRIIERTPQHKNSCKKNPQIKIMYNDAPLGEVKVEGMVAVVQQRGVSAALGTTVGKHARAAPRATATLAPASRHHVTCLCRSLHVIWRWRSATAILNSNNNALYPRINLNLIGPLLTLVLAA